ncbi:MULTISPECIES: hypothetical protein [Bacillota]|uniref:hypothetical protein n=1 Tax=Bacillota TaxID=1239 RepID=UPI0039F11CA4
MKEKVLTLQNKLNELVDKANNNEIPYENIFNHIRIRDFLPETEMIATIWNIEDLREKFPEDTPDHVLISALRQISGMLQDVAVTAGHEVIADNVEPSSFLDDDFIPEDENATCGNCGKTFHENEINMIDYDIDVCGKCEKELYL